MTAERYHTRHHTAVVDPRLDDVLDPIVAGFRRAVRGLIGDSDLLRQPGRPSPRHGGAVGRRCRRGFWRLLVAVFAAGERGTGAAPGARRSVPQSAGGLAPSWPRSRLLPKPLRWATCSRIWDGNPRRAYYADLCFLKPHDARALLGKPPRRDPADSPVFAQVTNPIATARRRAPCKRRNTPISRCICPTTLW